MRPLEETLAYQNQDVISTFTRKFAVSDEEAADIFCETKKWLWFAANSNLEENSITKPMTLMDEMWHTFLLFTKDYSDFCQTHFGHFIHHSPSGAADRAEASRRLAEDADEYVRDVAAKNRAQFEEIARLLGDQTLRT